MDRIRATKAILAAAVAAHTHAHAADKLSPGTANAWHYTASASNPPPTPTSLAFITPGVDWPNRAGLLSRTYMPNAANIEVIHVGAKRAEDDILRAVEQEVRRHGTLKTLVIDAHGEPGAMSPSEDSLSHLFTTTDFLTKIEAMQKRLGVKITDRIQFTGCNVFTELSASKVRYYRKEAETLGAELAGNTTIGWSDFHATVGREQARVAVFNPGGTIMRDWSDTPNTLQLNASNYRLYSTTPNKDVRDGDSSWFDCYAGRNQQEGEARQRDQLIAQDRASLLKDKPVDDKLRLVIGKVEKDHPTYNDMVTGKHNSPDHTPANLRLSAIPFSEWQRIYTRLSGKEYGAGDYGMFSKLGVGVDSVISQNMGLAHGTSLTDIRFGTGNIQMLLDEHRTFINHLSPQDKKTVEAMVKPYLYPDTSQTQQTARAKTRSGIQHPSV